MSDKHRKLSMPMKKKIFYLTGFMGSGKSTVGPIIANTLGWDYYDLDSVIEAKEMMKVSEIFDAKGELYFRNIETEFLSELSQKEMSIISLGGGTVTVDKNFDIIKNSGILIYLKISPETAYERLKYKRDRPILTRDGTVDLEKKEFIGKLSQLMEKRKSYYESADIIFETEDSSIGLTVDKLVKLMQKYIQSANHLINGKQSE